MSSDLTQKNDEPTWHDRLLQCSRPTGQQQTWRQGSACLQAGLNIGHYFSYTGPAWRSTWLIVVRTSGQDCQLSMLFTFLHFIPFRQA